jgi:hypothetical protein
MGAKTFFRRQGKSFAFSRVHTCHPQLKPKRDSMLALDELLGLAVGRGEMILRRDLKLHGHLHSIPHCLVITLHEAREFLGQISMPLQEHGEANRAYADRTY